MDIQAVLVLQFRSFRVVVIISDPVRRKVASIDCFRLLLVDEYSPMQLRAGMRILFVMAPFDVGSFAGVLQQDPPDPFQIKRDRLRYLEVGPSFAVEVCND